MLEDGGQRPYRSVLPHYATIRKQNALKVRINQYANDDSNVFVGINYDRRTHKFTWCGTSEELGSLCTDLVGEKIKQ